MIRLWWLLLIKRSYVPRWAWSISPFHATNKQYRIIFASQCFSWITSTSPRVRRRNSAVVATNFLLNESDPSNRRDPSVEGHSNPPFRRSVGVIVVVSVTVPVSNDDNDDGGGADEEDENTMGVSPVLFLFAPNPCDTEPLPKTERWRAAQRRALRDWCLETDNIDITMRGVSNACLHRSDVSSVCDTVYPEIRWSHPRCMHTMLSKIHNSDILSRVTIHLFSVQCDHLQVSHINLKTYNVDAAGNGIIAPNLPLKLLSIINFYLCMIQYLTLLFVYECRSITTIG